MAFSSSDYAQRRTRPVDRAFSIGGRFEGTTTARDNTNLEQLKEARPAQSFKPPHKPATSDEPFTATSSYSNNFSNQSNNRSDMRSAGRRGPRGPAPLESGPFEATTTSTAFMGGSEETGSPKSLRESYALKKADEDFRLSQQREKGSRDMAETNERNYNKMVEENRVLKQKEREYRDMYEQKERQYQELAMRESELQAQVEHLQRQLGKPPLPRVTSPPAWGERVPETRDFTTEFRKHNQVHQPAARRPRPKDTAFDFGAKFEASSSAKADFVQYEGHVRPEPFRPARTVVEDTKFTAQSSYAGSFQGSAATESAVAGAARKPQASPFEYSYGN